MGVEIVLMVGHKFDGFACFQFYECTGGKRSSLLTTELTVVAVQVAIPDPVAMPDHLGRS